MEKETFKELIQDIVEQACELKNKHTDEKDANVNYACIFSQSEKEYKELLELAQQIGQVIKDTPTGPIFRIDDLDTVAGKLRLLRIRIPDKTRPERGDSDFTVKGYPLFKEICLQKPNFKLIEREDFEMIELMDSSFNVRVYFSNPPLDQQLGIK